MNVKDCEKVSQKVLESFQIFALVKTDMEFLMGWSLALGLKECLVEYPTVHSALKVSTYLQLHTCTVKKETTG